MLTIILTHHQQVIWTLFTYRSNAVKKMASDIDILVRLYWLSSSEPSYKRRHEKRNLNPLDCMESEKEKNERTNEWIYKEEKNERMIEYKTNEWTNVRSNERTKQNDSKKEVWKAGWKEEWNRELWRMKRGMKQEAIEELKEKSRRNWLHAPRVWARNRKAQWLWLAPRKEKKKYKKAHSEKEWRRPGLREKSVDGRYPKIDKINKSSSLILAWRGTS
jgi:hypothetical protein